MKTLIKTPLKSILLLSLLSMGICAFAAKEPKEVEDSRNPLGCRDIGYKFELKILRLFPEESGARQSMYFLFNTLNQKVNLYQMRDGESSRSMFLNHAINPRQWAVFATSEKQVKFICTVPDGKQSYGKIVDCSDSLRVCEYTNVRFGLNNRGNYWIVHSNTRNGAIREVVQYGIIPAQ
ncbi:MULTISPECIES: endopeptidase IV [unclassified Legionella]|uniref:endopeptidase IV n=1 Tax=unclassified Legionella TaxID=2622702 RepID=UPI0010549D17|nr:MULTISPECIES: endopeptidase IV [unclassified Legionella]MDI9819098.1 endopeptidase IV [Legionella sp. PL877]